MKRKMLSSFHSQISGMETNKLYTLPTLLDPRFKGRVFSSSTAVVHAGQFLVKEFLLFQSSDSEVSERDNSVSAKRHRANSYPTEEKLSLWSSFDEIMATGEETDVTLAQPLSSVEVAIDSYLQETV